MKITGGKKQHPRIKLNWKWGGQIPGRSEDGRNNGMTGTESDKRWGGKKKGREKGKDEGEEGKCNKGEVNGKKVNGKKVKEKNVYR